MKRLQYAIADPDPRFVIQNNHALLWNREHLTPQLLHIPLEDLRGAREQSGRVGHVGGADSVHKQARTGKPLEQRAGSSGVVEVYVGNDEPGDPLGIETSGADAPE